MRVFLAIFAFILAFQANAEVTNLLKCLAQEEAQFHKSKKVGPIYNLNKRFMNQFASLAKIEITDKKFLNECKKQSLNTPSLVLLERLILKGESIFKLDSDDIGQRSLIQNSMVDIYEQLPETFILFISDVSALMPKAGCLEQKIPEIEYYLERFKYLQTEFNAKDLFDNKRKLIKIFDSLKDIEALQRACKIPTTEAKQN